LFYFVVVWFFKGDSNSVYEDTAISSSGNRTVLDIFDIKVK